jgi:hypothetical protein
MRPSHSPRAYACCKFSSHESLFVSPCNVGRSHGAVSLLSRTSGIIDGFKHPVRDADISTTARIGLTLYHTNLLSLYCLFLSSFLFKFIGQRLLYSHCFRYFLHRFQLALRCCVARALDITSGRGTTKGEDANEGDQWAGFQECPFHLYTSPQSSANMSVCEQSHGTTSPCAVFISTCAW